MPPAAAPHYRTPARTRRGRSLAPRVYALACGLLTVALAPAAHAQDASGAAGLLAAVLLAVLLAGLLWQARQSARQNHMAAVRNARQADWLRALLDSAGLPILATDTRGSLVSFNAAAQHLLGYRPEEVLGKTTPALLHDPEELMQRAVELARETGETLNPGFEVLVAKARRGHGETRAWTWLRKDGSRLPVQLTVTPVRNDAGVITGYMAIAAALLPSEADGQRLQGQQALLQATIDAMPGLYFQFDADGRMLAWNRTYAATLGLSEDEIRQMHALDVVHPSDVPCTLDKIRNVLEEGRLESAELRLQTRDGREIPVLATGGRVMLDGRPTLVGTALDLSEHKAAEAALEQSRQEVLRRNESLQLLHELSRRLHSHLSVDAICTQAIQAFMRLENTNHIALYQLSADGQTLLLTHDQGFDAALRSEFRVLPVAGTLAGKALAEGRLMHTPDLAEDARTAAEMRQRLAAHHIHAAVIIPLIHAGQAFGTIHLAFQLRREFSALELETLDTLGKTLSLALANARHVDRLDHLAHHDSLTGLPNRMVLYERFERLQARASGRPRPLTLLLLDLDRFKEINDTLGHYVGDQLLRQIGPRLQPLLAPREGLLCRLGGDEFAVLLPAALDEAVEVRYARDLVAALRRPFDVNEMPLTVDASVGIARYPDDGKDIHALMRAADVAMYAAKRSGQAVARYAPSLDRHSPERLALMAELNEAIRSGQLLLHYQPKFDLKRGRITGFEALVRWQHPRLGLLHPERFLPLAEMGDAIHALTEQVLDLALADLKRWQDEGRAYSVAVNLSARSLMDERFLVTLRGLLDRHGVQPDRLELEITETALMHDPERAAALLQRIADLGVKLSIDDYGTGYSSLGYLHRLPIHALKIDRMFVRDIPVNEHDGIIVRSTVAMAHHLGLEVLAEGVEDARTEALLREMGCDQIQGYHLSQPLPMGELTDWLAR